MDFTCLTFFVKQLFFTVDLVFFNMVWRSLTFMEQPIRPEDRVHCLVFFPRKLLLRQTDLL